MDHVIMVDSKIVALSQDFDEAVQLAQSKAQNFPDKDIKLFQLVSTFVYKSDTQYRMMQVDPETDKSVDITANLPSAVGKVGS